MHKVHKGILKYLYDRAGVGYLHDIITVVCHAYETEEWFVESALSVMKHRDGFLNIYHDKYETRIILTPKGLEEWKKHEHRN